MSRASFDFSDILFCIAGVAEDVCLTTLLEISSSGQFDIDVLKTSLIPNRCLHMDCKNKYSISIRPRYIPKEYCLLFGRELGCETDKK